jgi:hypothetical protein
VSKLRSIDEFRAFYANDLHLKYVQVEGPLAEADPGLPHAVGPQVKALRELIWFFGLIIPFLFG